MNPYDRQQNPQDNRQGSIYAPPQTHIPLPVQPQKQSPALGVIALACSIVLAPVGFFLGVQSIKKGNETQAPALTFLGVASIITSLLSVLIIGLLFILPAVQDATTKGFTRLADQSVRLNGVTVNVKVPANYEEIQTDEEAETSVIWGSTSDDGQLRITAENDPLTSDEMINLAEAIANNTDGLLDAMKQGYISDLAKLCSDPKIGGIESADVAGSVIGYKVGFTCTAESGDALQGVVIDTMTGTHSSTFTLLLPKDSWQKDQTAIEDSVASYTIAE